MSAVSDLSSPATSAAAVVPSDTTDLDRVARSLYVAVGGDLRLLLAEDTAPVSFAGVPAGAVLPVVVRRVLATGTTASGVVALY